MAAGRIKASARWPVVRGAAGSGPSGRLRSGRYRTADGRSVTTPTTFEAKADAGRYLSKIETDMLRGEWAPPMGIVWLADGTPCLDQGPRTG